MIRQRFRKKRKCRWQHEGNMTEPTSPQEW